MIKKVKLMDELSAIGIKNTREVFYNYGTPALYEQVVRRREGLIAHLGPLVVRTGYHTGRSPTINLLYVNLKVKKIFGGVRLTKECLLNVQIDCILK